MESVQSYLTIILMLITVSCSDAVTCDSYPNLLEGTFQQRNDSDEYLTFVHEDGEIYIGYTDDPSKATCLLLFEEDDCVRKRVGIKCGTNQVYVVTIDFIHRDIMIFDDQEYRRK